MLRRLSQPAQTEPNGATKRVSADITNIAITNLDDAALWPIDKHQSLVSTVDFFTPLVDDARTWGAIAAANSASDVYAMGGQPLFALNVVAWPRDLLPLDLLGDVLAGGAEVAATGGWVVVGGHSVDGTEPLYGMAVTGMLKTKAALTLRGAQVGDALVLTKPLGTGLLATAIKNSPANAIAAGGSLAMIYQAGVIEMIRLNATAASIALAAKATAATDVTGFGLLGHLREMTRAAGVSARIFTAEVPLLPGALELLSSSETSISGGSRRNLESLKPVLEGGDAHTRMLLSDAQTSGGLLFSCDQSAAMHAVSQLTDSGHNSAVIGEIIPRQDASNQPASSASAEHEGLLLIEGDLTTA